MAFQKDSQIRLRPFYEALLEGAMLGGQMAGGGIGVAVPEELILMHAVLEMGVGADPSSLRRFAPLFVEAVERWRTRAKDNLEGRDVPVRESGTAPGAMPTPGKPGGERFIKI